jgi:hypothetical protein
MSSSEEEADFDESEEDMPLAGLKKSSKNKDDGLKKSSKNKDDGGSNGKRRRSTSKAVSYAEDEDGDDDEEEFNEEEEDDDDDDDDDDVPLASLKSAASPSPKKKKANGKKAASPAAKKKKAAKKEASSTTTSSSSDNYQSPSAALYGSNCQKGQLIQKLLCRWWYAITWPDPSKIPSKNPKHYDPLDGIPGVYVCTSGDDVGVIKDFRDNDLRPNFANFAKKPAEELQTLLIKAIEGQKKILVEAEGHGTPTEKELNDQLKWARKLKPATADKEAVKVSIFFLCQCDQTCRIELTNSDLCLLLGVEGCQNVASMMRL